MVKAWAFLVALLGLGLGVDLHAADVNSVRVWRAPDSTRLVFDLSGPVEHKLFMLSNPARLVIDIDDAHLRADLSGLAVADSPIKSVRSAARNKADLRVVLDLGADIKPRSFVLPRQAGQNERLVVDLFDINGAPAPVKTVAAVTHNEAQRDIVIAIDAGHGGEDPGAIGPGRLREKDVVMAISRELAALINREPGYRAELVRTGDYYIPLRQRRNIARDKRADLFVSIHADAFTHPQANGASVFALSRSGATSETARFLAQKENDADLIGGVGSVSLDDKDEVLRGVLVDLSMTASLNSSLQVGDMVLKSMGKVARLHKARVEQAGFAVLKSPDVPSILVETGFISNPREAQQLNTSGYRSQLANAVFSGVKGYFLRYPPAGSYVAALKEGNARPQVAAGGAGRAASAGGGPAQTYVISRGDTLSGIAKRHNVSVNELLALNNLASSNVIKVGQKIKVPAS